MDAQGPMDQSEGKAIDIALRKIKMVCMQRINMHPDCIKDITLTDHLDFFAESTAARLIATFMAKEDSITIEDRGMCDAVWPANWWQAFRERWFPSWWLRRHPVRTVRHAVKIYKTYTRQSVCPHISPKTTNDHFYFLASNPKPRPEDFEDGGLET